MGLNFNNICLLIPLLFNFIQEICTKMADLTVRDSGRKNSIAKNIADEDKIKSEQDV